MMVDHRKKKAVLPLLFFLLLWNGCADRKQPASSVVEVDVTQIHPEKILLGEEGVASVEIISLETSDEFLCGGEVAAFTDEIIVYKNKNFKGGEILLFDRQGKALKKIDRQGAGGEEYGMIQDLVYDEANRELFVNTGELGVAVYDLAGNFKRSFRQINHMYYREMKNYDQESLICYADNEDVEHPFFLISKQTGEKIRDIVIPRQKRRGQNSHDISTGKLIKTGTEFLIFEPASDTIYSLNPSESALRPLLCRTPPIQTMRMPVFLLPKMEVGPFLFLTCLKKDLDFKNRQGYYPIEPLIYDCRNGKFYNILVFTGLFATNVPTAMHESRNNVYLVELPAHAANRDWEKWKKGISALNEDDNPVLIVVTLKE
jgi:hypothetical protein